jgi:hypothetical protein
MRSLSWTLQAKFPKDKLKTFEQHKKQPVYSRAGERNNLASEEYLAVSKISLPDWIRAAARLSPSNILRAMAQTASDKHLFIVWSAMAKAPTLLWISTDWIS